MEWKSIIFKLMSEGTTSVTDHNTRKRRGDSQSTSKHPTKSQYHKCIRPSWPPSAQRAQRASRHRHNRKKRRNKYVNLALQNERPFVDFCRRNTKVKRERHAASKAGLWRNHTGRITAQREDIKCLRGNAVVYRGMPATHNVLARTRLSKNNVTYEKERKQPSSICEKDVDMMSRRSVGYREKGDEQKSCVSSDLLMVCCKGRKIQIPLILMKAQTSDNKPSTPPQSQWAGSRIGSSAPLRL